MGVCVVLLAVLAEAVLSVSRKPKWEVRRASMMVVDVVERRSLRLPFVGADRRRSESGHAQEPGDARQSA